MNKFGFELCTNHSPANTQRCTVSVFLMESQTKHSFATVCPYLSTQLSSFSSQSLPCSLPCQKKISPFDYMLNRYQLTFYCPVTVLKHKTPDQENLIAFFKLTARGKHTHTQHPLPPKRTKQNMPTGTKYIAISFCTEDALLAFEKGKNSFITNHEIEQLLLQIQNK